MPVSNTIRRILSIYPVELPLFHPIAVKLQQLLESNEFNIDDVIDLANEDQVLASLILRMANSAAYSGSESVETIKEAVVRLGAQQVTNIAMAASLANLHASDNEVLNQYMHKLWLHSHAVALGCRWTAINVGMETLADRLYMAGLLHDIGKLYLLKVLEKLNRSGVAVSALEEETLRDVFIELHSGQGERLMKHWNMPQIYCKVVADHHDETYNAGDMVLTIVRLVNIACRKHGLSLIEYSSINLLDLTEAVRLHFTEARLDGLEAVLEDSKAAYHH